MGSLKSSQLMGNLGRMSQIDSVNHQLPFSSPLHPSQNPLFLQLTPTLLCCLFLSVCVGETGNSKGGVEGTVLNAVKSEGTSS